MGNRQRLFVFGFVVSFAALCLALSQAGLAQQPNIVFVMADDMGVAELGVTGQLARASAGLPSIDTPNLDSLAVNGVLMEKFYATPICASTRSAVMSGFHNGHSSVDRNGGSNGGNAIRDIDFTMAEMLKSAGYATAGYGKWGLGGYDHGQTGGGVGNISTAAISHPQAIPTNQGFDEFYGYLNQVHAHDYYVDFLWEQDGSGGMQVDPISSSSYTHDLMADRNLQFITDHADPSGNDPFFVYGAYTIPHSQFNPPNDAIRQDYVARGYSSAQANYAAMITRLDNTIGDIVDRLQDPNGDGDQADSVYDNTLIIFTSDNGGTPNENSLFGGDGVLRGTKGSVHEGGIRSPFIASWNGTIAPGQVDNTNIASLDDLFATFADLADADVPVGMDSASFAGVFNGGEVEKRASHVFEAGNAGDWAIVVGDWKLSKSGSNVYGLYNLATDPDENSNQFGASPAIANLLTQMALDEGVESDAGSSVTQTTNIVQYKSWDPSGSSEQWAATGNWSGGTAVNSRGTPANNFSSPPSANWIATVDNTVGGQRQTVVSGDSTVLGLHVQGTAGPMTVSVEPGATFRIHNGSVIDAGGRLELDGANLHTVRTIDIRNGGELVASGTISPGYDTSGTPILLESQVENAGRIEISGSSSGTQFVNVALNGGFELGSATTFAGTDDWTNLGADQTRNVRNGSSPAAGGFRGIVGVSSSGSGAISPFQVTGHTIASGDELKLDFAYAGAGSWDEGSDTFSVSVYYENNGSAVDLFTTTVNPSLNFAAGYSSFSTTLPTINDPNAVGKPLMIRFESNGAVGEFASIDQVSLSIATPAQALSQLTIDGDYAQLPDGVIAFDLLGGGMSAGIDFDQLVVIDRATLDGEIELAVAAGVTLVEYQAVELIDAGLVEGIFATVEGVQVASGRGLAVTYTADGVFAQLAQMGDANLDGVVDGADFNIWNANRFTIGNQWGTADFNGDGFTDVTDFNLWNSNKSASVSQVVPEPGAGFLLFIAASVLLALGRGRIKGASDDVR